MLAPHGGMIEAGTDRHAERVHAALTAAGRSARGWLGQGWKKGGGAKACWHVTSAEISARSFPKLGAMLVAKADHAVAFHGWTRAASAWAAARWTGPRTRIGTAATRR